MPDRTGFIGTHLGSRGAVTQSGCMRVRQPACNSFGTFIDIRRDATFEEKETKMDNFIISTQRSITLTIPIGIIFWLFTASYVIHILEEALLGENFVDKIKRLYWKGYSWKRFFWYNTGLIILNITAILLYENNGGGMILFPLIFASERCINGLYHVWESMMFKTFSSGLLTSVLFWILAYFLVKYSILKSTLSLSYVIISLSIGLLLAVVPLMILFLIGVRSKMSR
jgi:hypothetical protein